MRSRRHRRLWLDASAQLILTLDRKDGVAALAGLLQLTALQSLSLWQGVLYGSHVRKLLAHIEACTSVTHLDLLTAHYPARDKLYMRCTAMLCHAS